MQPPFQLFDGAGPIMATAIHAGHDLRPEIVCLMALDEASRLREEDPYTDLLAEVVPLRVVAHRSRFEVDLNRARDSSVYLSPEEAWGLDIWNAPPSEAIVAASRRVHDAFYSSVKQCLDRLAQTSRFAVLDIHSYNHRRDGPDAPPAPVPDNPDINFGTESIDRSHWEGLIDQIKTDLAAALPGRTVEENLRFKGGYFSRWINERYADRGCALALEFKKTFMNEWDGTLDEHNFRDLKIALTSAVRGVISGLTIS